jgi:hypothetical protein
MMKIISVIKSRRVRLAVDTVDMEEMYTKFYPENFKVRDQL